MMKSGFGSSAAAAASADLINDNGASQPNWPNWLLQDVKLQSPVSYLFSHEHAADKDPS
jgi:hypothetical protein